MAVIVFTKHDVFSEDMANGVHNFSSHTLKAALTSDIPDTTNDDVIADVTPIASTGGYAAVTLANVTVTRTGAVTTISFDPITWTPSGANFAEARGLVIYNDTPSSPADPIIQSYTFPTGIVLQDGVAWTRTINNTTGAILLG